MKRINECNGAVALAAAVGIVLIAATGPAFSWGFTAHRIVVETAAERMPAEAAAFFKKNVSRISDASLEPDTVLRARDPNDEGRKHFINLDDYEPYPFKNLPHDYEAMQALFGEGKVKKEGTLPWRIVAVLKDLTAALKKKDAAAIATQSGWLTHYLADSYQPLHLTKNHDGQESCNRGIHEAFESEMIDRNAARYRDALKRSRLNVAAMERPLSNIFSRMREEYLLVQRVLDADTAAMAAMKHDGKDYWEELERRAGPLAERQMSAAAAATASLWYTAWLEAGRPALP